MAMISTLRKHSWIVLVFIALSLIGFLLMDAFNSNSGLVKNRRQTFAEIDGSEITLPSWMPNTVRCSHNT